MPIVNKSPASLLFFPASLLFFSLLGGWLLSLSGYAALFSGLAAASFAALVLMVPVNRLAQQRKAQPCPSGNVP